MDLPAACGLCYSFSLAESCPLFGPEVLAFKVAGKLFALTSLAEFPPCLNLMGDPERSIVLREGYVAITPGFHMNRRHWNTVRLDGSLPSALVCELIRHSYNLVVAGLPAAARSALQ